MSKTDRNDNNLIDFGFRYHMYGNDVYRLRVNISKVQSLPKIIFKKEGNYGDSWHYGQITLNETADFTVSICLQ